MKQWWKRIVVFLAVACILLGTSRNVMAEGKIPTETAEKYFGKDGYYDVGGGIEASGFEIRSASSSLKAGDTVEVQIIYNADWTGHDLAEVIMYIYYDKDLLQYSNTIMSDNGDSSFSPVAIQEINKGVKLYLDTPITDPFNQNGCIATVQFMVKQDTSAVTIYGGSIDESSSDGVNYFSLDDLTADGEEKMMSVTITDTSEPEPIPETGTFALSDGTVDGNGEILIPIEIQTNDGFAALGLTINYDAAIFDYKSLEVDSSLTDKIALKEIYPTDGQIKAAFLAGQNITDTGSFLNLTLGTKEGVSAGTTSNVTITVTQAANYDEESLNGTGAAYTVTLVEDTPGQMLGDVNNDGNIDLLDALYILQYYNGVKELTDDEKTVADVDKNGSIDLVDALRIMKYYNGEISEF